MAGVEEQHRERIAGVLLLAGVSLILVGAGLLIHQQHQLDASQPVLNSATLSPEARVRRAEAIHSLLFLLIMLVVIFAAASLAFLRWSRRFRRWLLRKPALPTPSEDVWAMHRLPEDDDFSAASYKPGDKPL